MIAGDTPRNGIRVNALLPSAINIAMTKQFGDSAKVRIFIKHMHALKRIATPEKITLPAVYRSVKSDF